jgi:putative flippase GtrA
MVSPEGYQVKLPTFLIVGAINTTLTYILYVTLVYAGWHYNLALCLDYLVGILTGYQMNRYWTFRTHGPTRRSFSRYCAVYGMLYCLNMFLLNLLVGFRLLGPVFGQLVALSMTTVVSFLLQNFWVFRGELTNVQRKDV